MATAVVHGAGREGARVGRTKNESLANEGGDAIGDANRVNRGGSFRNTARNARSAYRNNWHPDNRDNDLGFRPAQGVPLARRSGSITRDGGDPVAVHGMPRLASRAGATAVATRRTRTERRGS